MALILKRKDIMSVRNNAVVYRSATYGIIMAAVLLCGTAALSSCEKKVEVINLPVVQNLPTMTAHNFETIYTDSGKVQMILRSPLLERYEEEKDSRNEFPEGLHAFIYDGGPTPKVSIVSKTAKYTEKDKLWELRDSVVVINEKGSILQTELLYWNEAKEMVYSDRYVKITDKDQISMGTGYEYDMRTGNYRIKDLRSTIYIENEK